MLIEGCLSPLIYIILTLERKRSLNELNGILEPASHGIKNKSLPTWSFYSSLVQTLQESSLFFKPSYTVGK